MAGGLSEREEESDFVAELFLDEEIDDDDLLSEEDEADKDEERDFEGLRNSLSTFFLTSFLPSLPLFILAFLCNDLRVYMLGGRLPLSSS